MKAFVYLRVSTDDQQYSPEVQRQQMVAYAALKGAAVVPCAPDVMAFDDTSVSGSVPFRQRPAAIDLLARLDEVDCVIFAKLDRAFRDTVDCILTVDLLRARGKIVHFVDLGIDTSTAIGQAFMEMSAVFAKLERRRISDRTREAMAIARQRGVKIGVAPFGMKNAVTFDGAGKKINAGVHVVDELEARVVARVRVLSQFCRMRNGRVNLTKIAETLRVEGFPTRNGGEWTHVQVANLLRRIA
jgi:DNA invertase Pin-like site-specific DNA recombinase